MRYQNVNCVLFSSELSLNTLFWDIKKSETPEGLNMNEWLIFHLDPLKSL